jgi:glycerate 2-kinase
MLSDHFREESESGSLTKAGARRWIKNTDSLNKSALHADALSIAEAAYTAIATDTVIRSSLVLTGSSLSVQGKTYNLSMFSRIRIIGFGKASCRAVQTLEQMLKGRITEGVAIDVHSGVCDIVEVEKGSHPRPSPENVVATEKIVKMAREKSDNELYIVVVSGGGSSLLCWPTDECEQGSRLYDDFTRVGGTIDEINLVRKHLSGVKGGGLAALLYPATVIGLVFCDVPGDYFEYVASGPTYYDASTTADAQAVLERYRLSGYTLNETPKDKKFFEKVCNVNVVSNTVALHAMASEASRLGYGPINVGKSLYEHPVLLLKRMRRELKENTAVIAGGEPSFAINRKGGKGGRCQYVATQALKELKEGEVLLAFASDGMDNSDSAGAMVDINTVARAKLNNISIEDSIDSLNTYDLLESTGDILYTGSTDANVSDLFLLLKK